MKKIKEKRLNLNLDKEEVARELGIAVETLRKIELGYRTPSVKVIIRMAKLYKCSVDELLRLLEMM